ncbi:MAG: LLM class flavin-dependent oxidoreductase [bacterium]|nr:LLM class flavin-dependent oxidoreductase [bacterium]
MQERVVRGEAEVARHREHHAAADHVAVQPRDRDRLEALDRLQRAAAELRHPPALARPGARAARQPCRRIGTVGAGAERAPAPAQHHHLGLEAALERLERRDDLFERGRPERVQLLRAVQPDAGDRAVVLQGQGLVGHAAFYVAPRLAREPRDPVERRAMEIGLNLPVMVPGLDRGRLEAWCRSIDEGPFSTLAVGERINFPNPELTVTLGAAAAWTRRVRLLYNVLVLPMHPEVLAAKQIATLDVVSGGRVVVGVGVGGREEDYAALGAQWDRTRPRRLERQVARMRRVWAGETVVPGALRPVEPAPLQPGGPTILAGSIFPPAIARAARWADGLCGFSFTLAREELDYAFGIARDAWRDAGRPAPPRLVTGTFVALGPDARAQMDAYLRRYLDFMGRAAEGLIRLVPTIGAGAVRDAVARARDAGADEVILAPTTADPDEVARLADLVG